MLRTVVVLITAFFLVAPAIGAAGAEGAPVQHRESDRDTIFVAHLAPLLVAPHRGSQAAAGTQGAPASGRRDTASPQQSPHGGKPESAGMSTASRKGPVRGVGTGGLLVNETFTVVGAQFYRAFYEAWSVPEEAAKYNFTITVTEQPAPRLGTQLTVGVEGTTLFQSRLRPNTEGIPQMARRATQRAALYLRRYYEPRTVY